MSAIILRVDETGIQITFGILGLVGLVIAFAIAWWWRQRSRVEIAAGWPYAEATIESGALEGTTQSRAQLPTFAFSYQVDRKYYSGRFCLLRSSANSDELFIGRMIGRKLQVQYDPSRPDVWFIPDKIIEGCEVEQKMGPRLVGLFPRD